MKIIRKPPQAAVSQLLASEQLPTSDITPERLEHFFGAREGSNLVGVVGLEIFDTVALLRSLVVSQTARNSSLGSQLLAQAEKYATEHGAESVFLLTTTAESYFGQRGYARISRQSAPEAIRSTAEYASLCPSSAVLMVKHTRR